MNFKASKLTATKRYLRKDFVVSLNEQFLYDWVESASDISMIHVLIIAALKLLMRPIC